MRALWLVWNVRCSKVKIAEIIASETATKTAATG
jgi:hypothetical protein